MVISQKKVYAIETIKNLCEKPLQSYQPIRNLYDYSKLMNKELFIMHPESVDILSFQAAIVAVIREIITYILDKE